MFQIREWSKQANIIADVLSRAPKIDKTLRVGREEFQRRHEVRSSCNRNIQPCPFTVSNRRQTSRIKGGYADPIVVNEYIGTAKNFV